MGVRRKPLWRILVSAQFADGEEYRQEATGRGDDFNEAIESASEALKSPDDFEAEGKDLVRLKLEVTRL